MKITIFIHFFNLGLYLTGSLEENIVIYEIQQFESAILSTILTRPDESLLDKTLRSSANVAPCLCIYTNKAESSF